MPFNPDLQFCVFDCDGVILQSNKIKVDSFRAALEGNPTDSIDAFIDYHKINGGISRYVKFEHYFTSINPTPNKEGRVKEALNKYAHIVESNLNTCPTIPGVEDILEYLKSKNIRCYVNSGGDQAELNRVFKERDLTPFFVEVLGSPKTKEENMDFILEKENSDKGIFFGDSLSDFKAAQYSKLNFIFIGHESEWRDVSDYQETNSFNSFSDFTEIINKL